MAFNMYYKIKTLQVEEHSQSKTHNFQMQSTPWIQNVAKQRQSGHIEKVLELDEPRFHPASTAIWSTIATLEAFQHTLTETTF